MQDFTSFMATYLASQQAQRFYRIQENIPISTEALPPSEQNIPLIDQPSETDTANDITEEGNFSQPNEDEE
jgi:hypothetical protein